MYSTRTSGDVGGGIGGGGEGLMAMEMDERKTPAEPEEKQKKRPGTFAWQQ